MITIAYLRLEHELARWRAIGRIPRMWWRDDDAREPTVALDRLLALADGLPLAMAVIPDGSLTALATCLGRCANVTVGQHGIDHVNRRPDGQPPGEFPPDTSAAVMAQSIAYSRQRLRHSGFDPAFYTPPWNRIDEALPEALAQIGCAALSAWDSAQLGFGGMRRLDAHIDLLRWSGEPHFRGRGRFYEDLRRQLARRRRANMMTLPIGLLTHHLVHDEEAWAFLGEFLAFARQHCEFGSFAEMIVPVPPRQWGDAAPLHLPTSIIAY